MASEWIIDLTTDNFDTSIQNGVILVDFWAAWCPPCRALTPILEDVAKEYAGKLVIGKVDVDTQPALSAKFGVTNIPALMLFQNGELVERLVGLRPMDELCDLIDQYVS